MNNDSVKDFFDARASQWDSNEHTPLSRLNALVDLCGITKGEKVLDLGAGTGIISGLLFERSGNVTALDISPNMLSIAREKHADKPIDFVCSDVYSYFGDSFDCIVIFNAYPHFLDRSALSDKLATLLKKGGRVVIIHSMGRAALNAHHSCAMNVSVALDSAEHESQFFKSNFIVDALVDDADKYMLRLIRK